MKNFKFISYTDKILFEIVSYEKKRRGAAAAMLRREVQYHIEDPHEDPSRPGEHPVGKTGNLKKGVTWQHEKYGTQMEEAVSGVTKIGFSKPASHAHLLEMGTNNRVTKDGQNRGKVVARPFFFKTLERFADKAIKIMTEKY